MNVDSLVRAATARAETVRVVKTAMNPMLWLVGLVTPTSFALGALAGDPLFRIVLLVLGSFPLVSAIIAYFVLLLRDPDRLQSEEYRLRQRALQMIYRKGSEAQVVDAAKEKVRLENAQGGFEDGEKR